MKPTQAVIDLSKKLWEKGVRKEIHEGDWFVFLDEVICCGVKEMDMSRVADTSPVKYIPIWTSCDECIEWLISRPEVLYIKSKSYVGEAMLTISIKEPYPGMRRYNTPTLIEALLKAMVEVVKMSEKKEVK